MVRSPKIFFTHRRSEPQQSRLHLSRNLSLRREKNEEKKRVRRVNTHRVKAMFADLKAFQKLTSFDSQFIEGVKGAAPCQIINKVSAMATLQPCK
jgi:hypothetical protein